MNLIKLNIGDKVFELIDKLEGEILDIQKNTATVLLSNGTQVFSHITNLVKLNNTTGTESKELELLKYKQAIEQLNLSIEKQKVAQEKLDVNSLEYVETIREQITLEKKKLELQESYSKFLEEQINSNSTQQFNPKQDSRQFNLVKEFHEAFNHPTSDKPTLIPQERVLNRSIWVAEEVVEGIKAIAPNEIEFNKMYQKFVEGIHDAYRKSFKEPYIQDETERIVALSDALTDASYFINGTFVELGVQPQPLFEIVQESNMSKLFTDENGNKYAKYREDGKILKSPEFFPPEDKLKEEIIRQLG